MENTEVDLFSWDFFKILFEYIITSKELILICILLIITLIIVLYATIRNSIYAGALVKNIISDNKSVDTIDFSKGNIYKELDKDTQTILLKQGLLLTLPISISVIFVFLFLLLTSIDLFLGNNLIQSIINLIGVIGMLFAIYVLSNINQNWFLHQLITNKCKISIETVTYIKVDYSENLYIKVRNKRYKRAIIQYIDTDYNVNIPTLYRSVAKNIVVGSDVFIIEMVNGKKYALATSL